MPIYLSPKEHPRVFENAQRITGYEGDVIAIFAPSVIEQSDFTKMLLIGGQALLNPAALAITILKNFRDQSVLVATQSGVFVGDRRGRWFLTMEEAVLEIRSEDGVIQEGERFVGYPGEPNLVLYYHNREALIELLCLSPIDYELTPDKALPILRKVVRAFDHHKFKNHLRVKVLGEDSGSGSYWMRIDNYAGDLLAEEFEWHKDRLLSECLRGSVFGKHLRKSESIKLLILDVDQVTRSFLSEPRLDVVVESAG